ncbi:MAG: hypothetical protein ABFE07_08955 [Armatimonadia bacterium]
MRRLHRDAERLFGIDEALRREADEMLAASGIGGILSEHDFQAVGSYAMKTMTWRDVDFELHAEPEPEAFWTLCRKLAGTGWCVRMQCVDHYREQVFAPYGLYCGLRVAPPGRTEPAPKDGPGTWKLDIWTMREAEAEDRVGHKRHLWARRMNDENRAYILAIKEAMCKLPDYGGRMIATHIYEAVLEQDIHDADSFFHWWRRRCDSIFLPS